MFATSLFSSSMSGEAIEISGDSVTSMSMEVLEVVLSSDIGDAIADTRATYEAFAS